jgi:hypothetical protein
MWCLRKPAVSQHLPPFVRKGRNKSIIPAKVPALFSSLNTASLKHNQQHSSKTKAGRYVTAQIFSCGFPNQIVSIKLVTIPGTTQGRHQWLHYPRVCAARVMQQLWAPWQSACPSAGLLQADTSEAGSLLCNDLITFVL